MKKLIAIIAMTLCMTFLSTAFAESPMATIKDHVDKVLEVLRDPSLKSESGKKAKTKKVRAIADGMFDFTEMSKRTLALNWRRFSPQQQAEFVSLFKDLLADTYADKIMSYTDEKISFTKEIKLTENTFEVQSIVLRKTQEIPINYRALNDDGKWLIYDVVIEGVSLVNNYRSQFREALSNKPPESLLETLRKKASKV
ncbi:MAG TPA: ABC transporter substrate-binding protein [Dissulfurispiraceae bacterium]|nr:ABC transporter substrate-binding protein [Dissulfurispiraceae bacterium]